MKKDILHPSQKLKKGFQVERKIAQTNYSQVYLVKKGDRKYILKVGLKHEDLDKDMCSSQGYEADRTFDYEKKLENEVRILSHLRGLNIISYEDMIDLPGGYQGLVLQQIENARTIRQEIEFYKKNDTMVGNPYRWGLSDDEFYLDLLAAFNTANARHNLFTGMWDLFKFFMRHYPSALKIMEHLASAFVQHRDVKPENILVTTPNALWARDLSDLVLIDFGLGYSTHNHSEKAEKNIAGNLYYRPPEAFHGRYYEHSDWWSWSLVFLELLYGEHIMGTDRPEIIRLLRTMGENDENKLTGNALEARLEFYSIVMPKIKAIHKRMHALNDLHITDFCDREKPEGTPYIECLFQINFEKDCYLENVREAVLKRFDLYLASLALLLTKTGRTITKEYSDDRCKYGFSLIPSSITWKDTEERKRYIADPTYWMQKECEIIRKELSKKRSVQH